MALWSGWLDIGYILPAGSPGSYSLSHTGDAYLSLHSLNGEGLSIAPSLQLQVCAEDSCRVDLNAVNPATQNPWIPTLSLAPFDLNLSSDPVPTLPLTPSTPPPTQTHTNWLFFALYRRTWGAYSFTREEWCQFFKRYLDLFYFIALNSYLYT